MLTIDSIEYISMKVVVIIASHNYDFKHNPCIIAYLFTIKKAFSLNLARLLTSLSNVIFIISLSAVNFFFVRLFIFEKKCYEHDNLLHGFFLTSCAMILME